VHDNFLVTAHVNADGDAIASTLAVGYALKYLDKDYTMIISEKPQEKYNFLEGLSNIKVADDLPSEKYKDAIVLDAPNLSRIGAVQEYLADEVFIINIDHHFDNTSFGNVNICNDSSSTAEILYRLIKELGIPFDKELAEMIYTGIIYDTGMFRFSSTTELAFTIGAEMKRAGARVDEVAEKVYFTKDYETMKLLSHLLSGLTAFEGGKIGIIAITRDDIKNMCSKKPDLDDHINYLMMIEGIEIGIFMIEIDDNYFRVSLRSRHDFDVQKIAAAFSGGGHKKAAGCRINGGMDEVKEKLVTEIKKYLPDRSKD
jgi:phosphoesterase RecJ-like protein